MKGILIKKKDDWFVEYLEGVTKALMPLHPAELKIEGLWKMKKKEVEFDIKKEYKGLRHVGEKDDRNYVEIYQNYAKLKIK